VTVCPAVDGTVTLLVAGVDAPTGPTAKRSMADRTTAPKAVANFNISPSCLAAPTEKDEAQLARTIGVGEGEMQPQLKRMFFVESSIDSSINYLLNDVWFR
jgi:hypothetical protein